MGELLESVRQARSPQEAIAYLAVGIEQVLDLLTKQQPADPWQEIAWQEPFGEGLMPDGDSALLKGLYEEMEDRGAKIVETDGETIIEISPPSEEKLEARRQFERDYLKLAECLGSDADPSIDYTEVYAKGGPLWLYHGNRDLFMSYGHDVRAAMCQDVINDSPPQGHIMAIDALKQPGESGPGGVGMATDTVAPAKRVYVRD